MSESLAIVVIMTGNAQFELDEEDMALIHALQIRPRASWSGLAPVLGVSAAGLARRWDRLQAEGLAWSTAYPATAISGGSTTALVEVDCAPGALDRVCASLDTDPHVMTIEHAARGRNLILTVIAASFADMSGVILDGLSRVEGVTSTRTHLCAQLHIEGSRWRLDALDRAQSEGVRGLDETPTAHVAPVDLTSPTYQPLAEALARDGRATAAGLAELTNRPASTVRRQLGTLLRSRSLVFRSEVAQLLTRWPVCVTWWCRVPADAQEQLVTSLRQEPRVRLCMSLTGPANFLVTMWTGSLSDLMRAQAWLEGLLGTGEIVDTSVILRTRKRMGWLLHPDGRRTGEMVPPTAS